MPGWQDYLSPSKIEEVVKGVHFPCSKQDIMNFAEDNHAPQHVLDIIAKLPDKQYNSAQEVASQAVKSVI